MSSEINKRIAQYRKKAGYTQIEVADILEIKHSTYSQRERVGDIEAEFLKVLAELFKVDIKILLYGDETETIENKNQPQTQKGAVFVLDRKEEEIIKIWRNLSAVKKRMFFQFGYDLIMRRIKNKPL